MGSFDPFFIPFEITPGDDTTLFTGFGSATGSLEVNDTGCADGGSSEEDDSGVPKDIEDTLVGADDPTFEDVNTNLLISNEVDLTVNFTYKVDKTAFDLFTTFNNLEEGDITERAKELAAKFGIKLDIKNLKKLARKELKEAAKGKKGEAKAAAVEEAKSAGINKLLSEILLKLPPLPPKGSVSEADREARKTIRKAKKAKILEGLEVELVSTTDTTMDGKAVKCLTFKITLPAKICAKDDGSKTLVIAGQNIMNLEVGETVTIDIPVKVTGVFKQFFGDSGKNGKNGKITIPLTLTNPAE